MHVITYEQYIEEITYLGFTEETVTTVVETKSSSLHVLEQQIMNTTITEMFSHLSTLDISEEIRNEIMNMSSNFTMDSSFFQ